VSIRTLPAKRRARKFVASVASVAAIAAGLLAGTTTGPAAQQPTASAEPCAPVELIFARGRNEQPGVGRIGNALVGALNARLPQPVGVYAVNYPANTEIAAGANDISNRIQYMAGACPDTRLIVGGYSLGSVAAALALSANQTGLGFNRPLPPGMDSHIAAVVLVGNFSKQVPGHQIAGQYLDRTIDICNAEDPVCSGGLPNDLNDLQRVWGDHLQDGYISSGLIEQAADFAAARVR